MNMMENMILSFIKTDMPVDAKFLLAREHIEDLYSLPEESTYFPEFNLKLLDILLEGTEVFDEWKRQKEGFLTRGKVRPEGEYDRTFDNLYNFRQSLNNKIDLSKTQRYVDSL